MSNWTFPQLTTAIFALSPVPASPSAAAVAINAQMTTLPPQNFNASAAQDVILRAGEWSHIILRARGTPSTLNTPADQAIHAAINAVAMSERDLAIRASDTNVWTLFQASMQALLSAGDISQTTATALGALRTPTVPTWQPAVTDQDCASAMGS